MDVLLMFKKLFFLIPYFISNATIIKVTLQFPVKNNTSLVCWYKYCKTLLYNALSIHVAEKLTRILWLKCNAVLFYQH